MDMYPALLTDSLLELNEQLELCQTVPDVQTVHVDIIDGQLVDNLTVSPADLLLTIPGDLQYDLHLMTDDPMDYVYETVLHKESLPIRTVVAQVEHMSFQADFLEEVRKQGWRAGLALDLHTPLEAIDELSWLDMEVLHLMSIELGFQGRQFQSLVLDKIAQAHEMIAATGRPVEIVVDGGITAHHLPLLKNAQVSGVCVGSAIWRSPQPINELQNLLSEAQASE